MLRAFSKYHFLCLILIGLFQGCLLDQGPKYINPCPCDITQFKDCDCDCDTEIEVSFNNDIIPFLEDYCVLCHAEECKYVNFKKGKAYENIIRYINLDNPVGSVVYQSIVMDFMPPLGEIAPDSTIITEEMLPSDEEVQMVLDWISQGARNN